MPRVPHQSLISSNSRPLSGEYGLITDKLRGSLPVFILISVIRLLRRVKLIIHGVRFVLIEIAAPALNEVLAPCLWGGASIVRVVVGHPPKKMV